MIFDRKKLQHALFLVIFLNSLIVMVLTIISMSTDYWVIARPYRQIFFDSIVVSEGKKVTRSSTTPLHGNQSRFFMSYHAVNATDVVGLLPIQNQTTSKHDNITSNNNNDDDDDNEDEEDFWPIDLYERKNCKRYYGKIRFGLFKGVWVFNYAYGCKNRVNRAYISDMLRKHKLFDQTLWISTILACSTGLFSITVSGFFSFINVFVTPIQVISGPIGMYLWNSLAGISYVLALIFFASEFYLFINKNLLTKEELESGWTSTNRAKLGWSYYILFVSVLLIFVNIAVTYFTVRLKRSFAHHLNTNQHHYRMSLLATSNIKSAKRQQRQQPLAKLSHLASSSLVMTANAETKCLEYRKMDADGQVTGVSISSSASKSNESKSSEPAQSQPLALFSTSLMKTLAVQTIQCDDADVRYSKRLKRLIDFIY